MILPAQQVFGLFESPPLFGRLAAAHCLKLAPEDLAQQHDAGIGFPEPLSRAIDERELRSS